MGKYYGCVRKTSPWYIRATFPEKKYAEIFISAMKNPDDWMVVEY